MSAPLFDDPNVLFDDPGTFFDGVSFVALTVTPSTASKTTMNIYKQLGMWYEADVNS